MKKEYKFFLAGEWRDSARTLEVINPYNGDVVGSVYQATEKEMDEAIRRAVEAFKITRALPSYIRSEILHKISDGIKERMEELARSMTLESGKPINDARAEVNRAVNTFKIASEEAKRIPGEAIPLDLMPGSEDRIGIVRRFPVGPVFGITPFNFPLNLVAHKIAPAIAVGNPIILKPASKTPITSLLLGEIISQSGAPAGYVSIMPCPSDLAEKTAEDERIKVLSFTGSAAVGWRLKATAGKKKVVLELGGNAGVIIHSDADLVYAAKRCTIGAFSYSGQICISVQRLYVHEDAFDGFLNRFLTQIKGLKKGDPLDETTNIGPMLEEAAAIRTEEWVKEAVGEGAKVLIGGKRNGSFFEPTVLTNTHPRMKVCSGEVFAPVVVLEKYRDFKDAIAMVNDSIYGLQAGVFTRDVKNIFYAFNELEVGGVIVNDIPTYRIDHMPYGGIKESGFGREGIRYAIEEMTEIKLLALNLG